MKLKKLSAAIALSLLSGAVAAQPYQAELQGGIAKASIKPIDYDQDIVAITGQWFFNTVDTRNHPLAEAAFLERASHVELAYSLHERPALIGYFRDGQPVQELTDSNTDTATARIGYYVPNTILYLGAQYQYIKHKIGSFSHSDNDWGVTLGVAPIDGLLITTEYWNEPGYDLNLQAQYVVKLAGENAVRLEAGYYDNDYGDDLIEIGGDFYLDNTWSIGAWIENANDTGFGLRTRKFFFDTFSVSGEYYKEDNYKFFGVSAALRF